MVTIEITMMAMSRCLIPVFAVVPGPSVESAQLLEIFDPLRSFSSISIENFSYPTSPLIRHRHAKSSSNLQIARKKLAMPILMLEPHKG